MHRLYRFIADSQRPYPNRQHQPLSARISLIHGSEQRPFFYDQIARRPTTGSGPPRHQLWVFGKSLIIIARRVCFSLKLRALAAGLLASAGRLCIRLPVWIESTLDQRRRCDTLLSLHPELQPIHPQGSEQRNVKPIHSGSGSYPFPRPSCETSLGLFNGHSLEECHLKPPCMFATNFCGTECRGMQNGA